MMQPTEVLLRNRTIWADGFDYVVSKAYLEQLIVSVVLALLIYLIQRLYFGLTKRWLRLLTQKISEPVLLRGFGLLRNNMTPLPQLSTPGYSPEEQLAACYDSAQEKKATDRQVLWTNIMNEGRYQNPSRYDKVEVLLLSWKVSDLDTTKEVKDLRKVFEEDFGYHTTTMYLNANSEKKLQTHLNRHVARFVDDYNDPNTLIIVYYGGHGGPGDFLGDLELIGHTSPNDKRDANLKERNRLVWNRTEDLLRHAEADVLEIFDCCCAGRIGLARGERRLFEYLAAVEGHDGTTKVPGPESFTTALIFALKRLVKEKDEGRFTTDELLRKIKTEAPKFPKDQTPAISNRDNKHFSAGRIMLHPLRHHKPSGVTSDDCPYRRATGYVMTLHFNFGDEPPDEHLKTLGRKLNEIFEQNTLGVHRVDWGGLEGTPFIRAAQKFQKNLMKRRASSQSQRPTMTLRSSTSSAGPVNTGLLSPSAVAFDGHDSGGEDSGSVLTTSAPTTPAELSQHPVTMKDELGLVQIVGESTVEVGESTLEEALKAKFENVPRG